MEVTEHKPEVSRPLRILDAVEMITVLLWSEPQGIAAQVLTDGVQEPKNVSVHEPKHTEVTHTPLLLITNLTR
eukprot:2163358-Amphidinium_carterae.1